jgi:hypothetical protein
MGGRATHSTLAPSLPVCLHPPVTAVVTATSVSMTTATNEEQLSDDILPTDFAAALSLFLGPTSPDDRQLHFGRSSGRGSCQKLVFGTASQHKRELLPPDLAMVGRTVNASQSSSPVTESATALSAAMQVTQHERARLTI